MITEALAGVDQVRHYEAEMYRIKGELLLAQESREQEAGSKEQNHREPNPKAQGEAEACFLKAIAVAQKQQAKSLELRGVMSLARLRQHQAQAHATRTMQHAAPHTRHETRNKLAEAHKMLSEIYNWFTEGFDTVDLQEAKTLLHALA
jgi:hypothetical protein